MRTVLVSIFCLGLSACTFKHEVRDLEPPAVRPPSEVLTKVPGSYAVAIVGDFETPLVLQSRKISGRMIGGEQEITIVIGHSLKKSIAAALSTALADPVFVDREDQARALARRGTGAIIVRYEDANAWGELRQSGFGYYSSLSIRLGGRVVIIRPDASGSDRRVQGTGSNAQEAISWTWSGYVVPPAKAAAELAIAEFTANIAAEISKSLTE